MLKFIVFTVCLILSPTFGLIQNLFRVENDCYSGCLSNYAENLSNLDACKTGCDYKLQNEKCADQCKLLSIDGQIQASCLVGCSMVTSEIKQSIEKSRPKSIILIRLRKRPLVELPSFNTNPVELFSNMIQQLKYDKHINEVSNDLSKLNDVKALISLKKHISDIKLSNSHSLNQDNKNNVKHFIISHEDNFDRLQQFTNNIRSKLNNFICKQPQILIWIILTVSLLSSITLWYMIVALCSRTPKHNLSIQAQELVFEKELIQPNEITQSLPIKIKLENI